MDAQGQQNTPENQMTSNQVANKLELEAQSIQVSEVPGNQASSSYTNSIPTNHNDLTSGYQNNLTLENHSNPAPGQHMTPESLNNPTQESHDNQSPDKQNETASIQQQSQQPSTPQRAVVTKVKLSDELNIFDWLKTSDIIHQIAEKAKNSVDSVITALDPGMKEYLYSGGNVNIIVLSDYNHVVSPIRDAFQIVFGRATVVAARYDPPLDPAKQHPVKLACGFDEAIIVARERIKQLRLDTSKIPQNQVVVALQPTLVSVFSDGPPIGGAPGAETNGLQQDDSLSPRWFLTYCMIIEDPVLGSTMSSYSQFIPIDLDTVAIAREANFPANDSTGANLGFARSIDDLMNSKLKLTTKEGDESDDDTGEGNKWIQLWAGLDETRIIHELGLSLAHSYRRKWNWVA